MKTLRAEMGEMPFLVPGLGAQGGDLRAVLQGGLDLKKRGLILAAARSIIFAEDPELEAKKLKDEINIFR